MDGWIKIHRKMLENPIVTKDADHIAVWVYLMLNATHKECPGIFKGKRITLERGQLITGSISIANTLKLSESKVRRCLKNFESDGQIDRQPSNKNSLITILNWDMYQTSDEQSDGQVTDKRQTSDGQVTTNKNDKNVKNVKNEKNSNKAKPKSVEEVAEYCRERGNKVDPQKWWDYYSANGWKVGRNSMKDWKASVRTWEKNNYNKKPATNKTAATDQRSFDQYADYLAKIGMS